MATPDDGTDPTTPSLAEDGVIASTDGTPPPPERRARAERRAARPETEAATQPAVAGAAARPGSVPDQGVGLAGAAERRRRKRRQPDRSAAGAAGHEDGTPRISRRRESMLERRQERELTARRRYWSSVRREVERRELGGFLATITQLAQHSFGPTATAVPHLRGKGPRSRLIIVVDAAHPEATTSYNDFVPLEEQFWTAFGTIAKPAGGVTVAVRPARGWLRSELRAPVYTQFGGSGIIS